MEVRLELREKDLLIFSMPTITTKFMSSFSQQGKSTELVFERMHSPFVPFSRKFESLTKSSINYLKYGGWAMVFHNTFPSMFSMDCTLLEASLLVSTIICHLKVSLT